jgi:hypothetical protein
MSPAEERSQWLKAYMEEICGDSSEWTPDIWADLIARERMLKVFAAARKETATP